MKFNRLLVASAVAMALASGLAAAKTPADQLIVGMSMNNLLSLDPAGATGNDVVEVNANMYDSLVELDPADTYKILPGLAESWTVAPDNRSITFKIRKGVKFHSGNPLTAEDAAWSLQRVLKLNLALASVWKSYGFSAANVEQNIRALDAETLVLTLPEPTDPKLVIYTLGTSVGAMVLDRKKVMANEKDGDMGKAWLTTNEAGSGPFALNDWRQKDVLLMSRFDGYWRGPAKLKRVVLRHMTESQTLRLMLERGDIDVAAGMSVPDVESMKKNPNAVIEAVKRGNVYYVAVSVKDPKFADKRVRQAIRALIDYDGINKTVMPNYGLYHQRPVQMGLPATLPNPGYKLDVPAAKKLLAEAGFPNGFKTTIRVLSDPPFINIATNLQSTLALGGIEASVVPGTGNQVYGAMRDRNFEIIVGRGGGGAEPHPHSSLRSLVYNPDNRDEAKLTNFQGWRTSFISPEINALIEKAEVEQDEKKQTAMYQEVQKLYDAQVGAIQPVSQMVDTVVLQKDLRNFHSHPASTTRWREVYKQR
ncbi:ABC transporter substrate-binding protein [Uliginosibacterium aquaticum]|uniref:ABC transporter substrate-binding protein n=1 Tax=Uliginosibacterium aquaticum TaxID=2731212 RepID=A0ABX2IJB8_9RHOO|nr:ABC transporter substrate-binding protein [Uliginosibacterium aquaticum]NSL56928.1 ABC transporter substrate-binding protein [Uliginosibacterium aquaticum]